MTSHSDIWVHTCWVHQLQRKSRESPEFSACLKAAEYWQLNFLNLKLLFPKTSFAYFPCPHISSSQTYWEQHHQWSFNWNIFFSANGRTCEICTDGGACCISVMSPESWKPSSLLLWRISCNLCDTKHHPFLAVNIFSSFSAWSDLMRAKQPE